MVICSSTGSCPWKDSPSKGIPTRSSLMCSKVKFLSASLQAYRMHGSGLHNFNAASRPCKCRSPLRYKIDLGELTSVQRQRQDEAHVSSMLGQSV